MLCFAIAVNRLGKRFISFVCGDRGTKTGLKLWEQIKNISVNSYCSDFRKPYEGFVSPDKHIQTKAETYTLLGIVSYPEPGSNRHDLKWSQDFKSCASTNSAIRAT